MGILARSRLLTRPLLHSACRQFRTIPPWGTVATQQPDPSPSPTTGQAKPTPLIYPESASSEHHNLSTFHQYANRISLDKNSSVFTGTCFEYTAAEALAQFGFNLRRIGRAGDCGIDLLGTWTVPSAPQPLRVLLQCKAMRKAMPSSVRELEGAFAGAPPGWRGSSVLAFLVTDHPATPGVRKALMNSQAPMGYVYCTRGGDVHQILWNYESGEQGLAGLGVSRWHNSVKHVLPGEKKLDHKVTLTWQGRVVPFLETWQGMLMPTYN